MTQTSFPFSPTAPALDGFEQWWKLFPKYRSRKVNKRGCAVLWKRLKLAKAKDRVMAALQEDIRGIERGDFAFTPGSNDKLYYFPGPHPWLNGGRWDRELDEPKPVGPDKDDLATIAREQDRRQRESEREAVDEALMGMTDEGLEQLKEETLERYGPFVIRANHDKDPKTHYGLRVLMYATLKATKGK